MRISAGGLKASQVVPEHPHPEDVAPPVTSSASNDEVPALLEAGKDTNTPRRLAGFGCADAVDEAAAFHATLILDVTQKMQDGYSDSYVEYLVVDLRRDPHLAAMRREVKELLHGVPGLRTRAKVLALYVSNRMGGTQKRDVVTGLNIVQSCMSVIGQLKTENGGSFQISPTELPKEEILLGSVTHGLCRHRAQLFKYLADVDGVDIPCRLYRNFAPNGEEIRVWNTVPVSPAIDGDDSEWVVVAVMHNPARLLAVGSTEAGFYLRREPVPEESPTANDSLTSVTSLSELAQRRYMPPVDFEDPRLVILRHRELGGGTYGKVYKCSLKGYVFAEKEVPVRYADDADRALKIKELQVLRKLDHPNICAFLGFQHREDEARGRKVLRIFMEMADETLDSYLLTEHRKTACWDDSAKKKDYLATGQFAAMAMQVLKGLEYLHQKSPPIIHRDIKPLNVLLYYVDGMRLPLLKLADFGVSNEKGEDEIRKTKAGSPFFIAPEVEDGHSYDMAADIYSFGVMCAVMVALESPWHMDSELLADVIANNYPRKVHNLLVECLQEKPEQRLTAPKLIEIMDGWNK